MIGSKYRKHIFQEEEMVHTGLYSKKAARLLDWMFSFAYQKYLANYGFLAPTHFLPQNFESSNDFRILRKTHKSFKPHLINFTTNGEIVFYLNCAYTSHFYYDLGTPSRKNILTHLDILFSAFYLDHSKEQNNEMERLRKTLASDVSREKYADLYGTPFDAIKSTLLDEYLKKQNELIEFKKTAKKKMNNAPLGEQIEKYRRQYFDAVEDIHRNWWKMYLLLE